jgi:hypothetical protein
MRRRAACGSPVVVSADLIDAGERIAGVDWADPIDPLPE